jgi:hypothetical protein
MNPKGLHVLSIVSPASNSVTRLTRHTNFAGSVRFGANVTNLEA